MRPSASADHFRFLDLAPVVSAETNKSNTKFGAERSSGPQTKNRPKIACCAQLSATSKRSQLGCRFRGRTPAEKEEVVWFNSESQLLFFSELGFLKADFANKQSEPIQRARRTSGQTARLASKSRDIGTPDWHGARCLLFAWAALAVDVLVQGPWGCLIFFVLNPRSRAPTAAIAAQTAQ